MTSWTAGYVLDIPYTSGFYRELAPAYLSFALLAQGVRPSTLGPGATYCELACGQGFGTALLAAANPDIRFWGLDFNPAQIANARRLAAEAGLSNVTFEDWSFAQAAALPADALPSFDVVALHGIYSWISPENRRAIVDFLDRRLKPGGVVYVSYNCMPGWAATAPLQRLMREHADRHADRSDLQAEAALTFAGRLKEGGALYFAANPALGPRMEKLPGMNRNYLAHEYLNGHWHPLYHLDVARELEAARLVYAGTATLTEAIDAIAVPEAVRSLLAETRDPGWRETIRDYASNKGFRRDLFVRGATSIGGTVLARMLGEARMALTTPRAAVSFKFQGPLGELTAQEDVYVPIADALAQAPRTVAELAALPELAGRPFASVQQAASMLVHGGAAHPVLRDLQGPGIEGARAFNRMVAGRIRDNENLGFLAAPALGTGIPATYTDLVGVLALAERPDSGPAEAAALGWSIMEQTGQRLVKDGKTLQSREEAMPELEAQLGSFFEQKLPIWRRFGVI
jgi:SAM-dependent methyltransferase